MDLEGLHCGPQILIIDDEEDIREVAALSLETVAGWEVMSASSGAQGWPAPSSTSPTPFCST